MKLLQYRGALIFSARGESESCGNSWCDLWDDLCGFSNGDSETLTGVLVVTSSVVAEIWEGVTMDTDWECVEPQSSSFSKKRSFVWAGSQEEMSYEESPVKAPPVSRRRTMPPTPQQSSYSSIEDMQWQTEMEVQGSSWSARERTVIGRME